MPTLSRGFILNRVFAADRWLQEHYGKSVLDADQHQMLAFLDHTPDDLRESTLYALQAHWDDLVRKGRAPRNVARTITLP